MSKNTQNCIDTCETYLMKTYNRFPVVFEKGEGVYLYDTDGKKYLDFAAGIAVFALGYNNKQYNDALKSQIDQIIHTSNLYYNVPTAYAAEKLAKASHMDRVFFTNSGTEAIEGAIKLARKYAFKKHPEQKSEIISMNHSFHGRSTGALAVTGNMHYQEAFRPLMSGVKFATFNDLESVKEQINEHTCAIILEPIQGEGGIYPATKEFLQGVRDLCDEHDMALIFDEIQCGMGRSGYMFAHQEYGIKPDILTCAKALGCGVPVGAFVATKEFASAFEVGDHGTTYGGNPLATRAVSEVFDLFESMQIPQRAAKAGQYLWKVLDQIKEKHTTIVDHRGKGLMQGLEFDQPVRPIIEKALEHGLVIISAGSNIIRFIPPLVISEEEINRMAEILNQCLDELGL